MTDLVSWSKEILLQNYLTLHNEHSALELSHFQELEDLELELAKAELQVQQAEAKAEKAQALAAEARENAKNECLQYQGRNRTLQLQNDDLTKTSDELKIRLRTAERRLERVESENRVMAADLQNKIEEIEKLEEEKILRDEMEETPAPRSLLTATHRMQALIQQRQVRDLRIQLGVAQREAAHALEFQNLWQLEKEKNLLQEASLQELLLSIEVHKKLQAVVRSDREAIFHARSCKLEEKEQQFNRTHKLNQDLAAKRVEVDRLRELRKHGAGDVKELERLDEELQHLSKEMHTIIRSRLARQRFAKIRTVTRFMAMGKLRSPPKHSPPPRPQTPKAERDGVG